MKKAGTKTMLTAGIKKGITLVELLVVFSLIAIMGGIGLGIWSHSGKQVGFQAQRGEINAMIQLVQTMARIEKRSVSLTVDPAAKEAYYITKKTYGQWHFEDYITATDTTTGAFGLNGQLSGPITVTANGYVGSGLFLENIPNSSSPCCRINKIPLLNRAEGLMVELAIYPTLMAQGLNLVILYKNGGFSLMLTENDSIRLTFGESAVSTTANTIRCQRWTPLCFMFEPDVYGQVQSNGKLSLYLNGVLQDQLLNVAKLAGEDPITIGASEGGPPFIGMVDELRISGLNKSDPVKFEPADTVISVTMVDGSPSPLTPPFTLVINKDGYLAGGSVRLRFSSNSLHDSFEVVIK
ncbi:MAG: LamG-like jellyroll fold domain-containing protein [Planctomycetota bacterium]